MIPVGSRVVARDAGNQLHSGAIERVPADWRDQSGSESHTTKGAFPKVWVRFVETDAVVPWPAEDVFTDAERANAAVAAHEADVPAKRP